MNKFLLLIFLIITSICKAEHKIKIYYKQNENGYKVYADNYELCPISVKIEFKVTNLKIEGGNNNIYVIDANSKGNLLTSLKISNKKRKYKVSSRYWTNYGIHNNQEYDKNYRYNLPFRTSNKFEVYQGYNGSFSHQNENSLDFTMPIGTDLMAVRDGIVIKVIDKNRKNCGKEECKKYNNLIIIYHPDGTFAEYTHIKQYGAKVKVGDKVSKGQLIGYSGNVGWSTGPHLHLVIFNQNLNRRKTLKTKFKTGDGSTIEYLAEKEEYSRNYQILLPNAYI